MSNEQNGTRVVMACLTTSSSSPSSSQSIQRRQWRFSWAIWVSPIEFFELFQVVEVFKRLLRVVFQSEVEPLDQVLQLAIYNSRIQNFFDVLFLLFIFCFLLCRWSSVGRCQFQERNIKNIGMNFHCVQQRQSVVGSRNFLFDNERPQFLEIQLFARPFCM